MYQRKFGTTFQWHRDAIASTDGVLGGITRTTPQTLSETYHNIGLYPGVVPGEIFPVYNDRQLLR